MLSSEQGLSDVMSTSLFLVGEIGGNDFNRALFRGKSADEVTSYIPDIIAVISATVTELIGLGAKRIVVPGNFPIGCSPGYLTKFQTNDTSQYDAAGCLKWANNLTQLHNAALKVELALLGQNHPDAAVLYADYYTPVMSIVADPGKQGFAAGTKPLVSCCGGGGGPYNVDFGTQCGAKGSTVCADPGAAVSWDGFHFTEHVYKVVVDAVMPSVLASCGTAGGGN
ncbi:hypothetical protein QOZ80_7BG0610490 [Eleusine coracana subsp. coracana]|nr:hypothetical protein QOZ80_7BG0610490 [Eleusine coracana subsp. coracana]